MGIRAGRARVLASLGASVLVASTVLVVHADLPLSRREADSFTRKVSSIQQYAGTTLTGARVTPVSEGELNSYIRYELASVIPTGVVDPYVSIVGDGEVHGRATVDLDAVRRARPRGWLDPLGYVSGRVPVTATGRLTAQNGVARLEIATTTVSGVPVPKTVLQELVSFYSRSPETPAGVDLDAPFDLPARIQEINVERGRAVVIQR